MPSISKIFLYIKTEALIPAEDMPSYIKVRVQQNSNWRREGFCNSNLSMSLLRMQTVLPHTDRSKG